MSEKQPVMASGQAETSRTDSGRIYGGESAAERLARQRRQFMDAGLELFGTQGYRATTVRGLCKQAGLIDRYFYKNFTDTEDLLDAIYRASMEDIQSEVVHAMESASTTGDLSMIAEAGLNAFFAAFENPRIARVCWLEVLGVSPRIDTLYTSRVRQFANLFLAIALSLLPAWKVPDEEAEILAIAVVGAISQSALHWLLSDYRASRRTLVAATSTLIRGVVLAIAAQAGNPDPE
jgi:AcrR family transcriptional regulator